MYILPNEDMLGGSSGLLNEEPHYVTKLTTAYGAGIYFMFFHFNRRAAKCVTLTAVYWAGICTLDIPALLYEEPQSAIH
jgi:hypothetical protein